MGRVLLSALPEEQLEVTLSRVTLIRYTPHTLCDLSGLRAEIARVRMQGYALADRQIEVGLCSLAVPVLSRHGQVVAARECRGTCRDGHAPTALKEKASRPATARGDGSVAAAIAPTAFRHGGEAAPDPGGQQQKQYTRRRQHQDYEPE